MGFGKTEVIKHSVEGKSNWKGLTVKGKEDCMKKKGLESQDR